MMATVILPLIHQPGCRSWDARDNDDCTCTPIEFRGTPTCEATHVVSDADFGYWNSAWGEPPIHEFRCGQTPTTIVVDPYDGAEYVLCTECAEAAQGATR